MLLPHRTSIARLPAKGNFAGKEIETTVDSEVAKYYLENYKQNRNTNPELHLRIDQLRRETRESDLTREYFQDLTRTFSTDFAASFFADFISETESNKRMQSAVDAKISNLKKTLTDSGKPGSHAAASKYLLLFMPGWHYKSFPESGADFARPRAFLRQTGFQAELIETDENGSVEDNAAIIAREIIRYSSLDRKIILVGASKSCPEGLLALGELLKPEQSQHVKALINIGGILQGTLLANFALSYPLSWFIKPFFYLKRWGTASLRSMLTERRRACFLRLNIPAHILVFSYIGVPLSGQVSDRARNNYLALREYGPNDGLTLLTDGRVSGGVTMIEPGCDHYFLHPDIDLKAVALALTVIDSVELKEECGIEVQA